MGHSEDTKTKTVPVLRAFSSSECFSPLTSSNFKDPMSTFNGSSASKLLAIDVDTTDTIARNKKLTDLKLPRQAIALSPKGPFDWEYPTAIIDVSFKLLLKVSAG